MYIRDVAPFISILIEFADKRRSWQHVQLDLLYTVDRPRIILHAELSSWCLERVSMSIPPDNIPRPFRPETISGMTITSPIRQDREARYFRMIFFPRQGVF